MSLMRQIAWLVLGVVLAALVGAVGLSMVSARQLMRTQLELKNADNAQALALALSQQQGDRELIKLLVSAQFDTGAYEFVRWRSAKGETLFERAEAPRPGQAPSWFRNLLPIEAAPGVAQLSNGWNAIGAVELKSHSSYAHDTLWLASRRLLAWLLVVGIVAAVIAWAGLRRIRRPLDAAVAQAEGVLAGSYGQVVEPRVPELQRLTRAMNAMVQRVRDLFEAQAGQLLVLREQVHHDPLTGVSARKHFMAELDAALRRDDGPAIAGLVLVRLRDLSGLNSRLGRGAVDDVLLTVVSALQAYPESVAGCRVGRLNGGDFALWLPAEGVAAETAHALADALRASLPAFGPGVQVALGAIELPRERPSSVWLGEADAALARAEHQSEARGGFVVEVVADPGIGREQGESLWRAQLQEAVNQQRGRLVEFPVRDRGGRVLHLECPLQLQLDAGFEPATAWLPLAVRARMTAQVDLLAVGLALKAIAADGKARCINVAPVSLADAAFLPQLRELLAQWPQAARSLLLDLAEAAATEHFERLLEFGRQLRPLGVKLGLEHAGAGLAQVEKLYQAGLDYVKLDASVLLGVAGEAGRAAFVRGMVIMLRSLALKVYGEGVVDEMDAQALWDCELDGLTGPWVTNWRG
ncbi:EAL domain-containing protein (putative c-di-GMP-specific phosphodiesterase class I)/GGDEF domain-containing protein [Pelomonas saccharophila]|uniref:EAL domain-containing protein (Putative c-di-GMP-specific phosphodiesterase class I)/GGDEF domain-containing protein n=1 Tax=Roseateles saccharophilus TaxID=304 RepID=A0ABU1YT88_ROSSA|nr:LapD/MoxY N-terminal periplasmic domain-containing protein [Roseateles saccharophilus]MDR7271445.1 EAL domain-containing protein (putative c-di-GMP-specific phosphodiesterase class I)/GGDEF domain-containing protein [Roseateles saccharophilus]